MRHFQRLNRVGSGIPGQLRQKVWTLPEQPHRLWFESQPLCTGGPLPSQIMCAGNRPLLRVGPFIIVRRYTYREARIRSRASIHLRPCSFRTSG
jgi:hypothetical protein